MEQVSNNMITILDRYSLTFVLFSFFFLAYDIAGKGIANPSAFKCTFELAKKIGAAFRAKRRGQPVEIEG
jgi:hypothetical protein